MVQALGVIHEYFYFQTRTYNHCHSVLGINYVILHHLDAETLTISVMYMEVVSLDLIRVGWATVELPGQN